jgi:hypothetical protein
MRNGGLLAAIAVMKIMHLMSMPSLLLRWHGVFSPQVDALLPVAGQGVDVMGAPIRRCE